MALLKLLLGHATGKSVARPTEAKSEWTDEQPCGTARALLLLSRWTADCPQSKHRPLRNHIWHQMEFGAMKFAGIAGCGEQKRLGDLVVSG